MGGFYVFPGGQRDAADSEVAVLNADDPDAAAMLVCAARETLEEIGVLLATSENVTLSTQQLQQFQTELAQNTTSFKAILMSQGLMLDMAQFVAGGRWVTPPFAPRRFDTWFFIGWLPAGQEPTVTPGELVAGEWIRPQAALARWQRGEIMLAPPTLHIIRTLAAGTIDLALRLTSIPEANRGLVRRIEMRPGILLFPLLTPTLPPATHTNCYLVGNPEFVIIDPASPYEEEQVRLAEFIQELLAQGMRPREIILSHFHPDHVGGANALRQQFQLPVAASAQTKAKLDGRLPIDRIIKDGDLIALPGQPGWNLRALHTPGHTQDHLVFFEEQTGALISGDLIVGVGTVVIDPPEGNMADYLQSLARVQQLPVTAIFGSHGPPIGGAAAKIQEYISHRLQRETAILNAIAAGAKEIPEIVRKVYFDVPEKMHKLAERSVLAHLEKLIAEDRVQQVANGYTLTLQL
jgi:glyoxylase-like metal-dependent hydrolase (beta-lactamase superfamily II)/8-oxo-dGTP pyrophosphatase MutT (NUDIX family)